MTIFIFKMMVFCRLGFRRNVANCRAICRRAFIYAYLSVRFCLRVIACTLLSARYYPARCCLWTCCNRHKMVYTGLRL